MMKDTNVRVCCTSVIPSVCPFVNTYTLSMKRTIPTDLREPRQIQSPSLMGVDHGGQGTNPLPQKLERGTLMQIAPPPDFVIYRYKNERSVAFKIRQNPFSAGAVPRSAPDPAGGAHDAPSDPLVGWRGDTLPKPHPTRHGPTLGARHASPRSPARSTPMPSLSPITHRHRHLHHLHYHRLHLLLLV